VRSLQREAVRDQIFDTVHFTTVADILRTADLQPHRFGYWKTTVWDEAAIKQAAQVLWCYERADWLWAHGQIVMCIDEKPNLQVLERIKPIERCRPGKIERQEFEYRRHGTINLLGGLRVHDGWMWAECLDANDGEHFRPAIKRLFHSQRNVERIHLILDGGSSHISGETKAFLAEWSPWVRVLYTPPHASWLNQAELLLRAFSERYLKRGSWETRQDMVDHILASRHEHNRDWACPFEWSWTRREFRLWRKTKAESKCCKT